MKPPKPKIDGRGQRKDAGKLPLDLLPADVLLAIAAVLRFGAKKYAARNWERGMPYSKVYGPMQRHALDFALGKRVDAESKLRTSAHLACDALFLCAFDLRGMGHLDDLEPYARRFKQIRTAHVTSAERRGGRRTTRRTRT